jgi:hypothetical protein
MEVLQAAGVSEGETLKPITADAKCDHCDEPAKYAELTLAVSYLCNRHRGWSEPNA